MKTSRDSPAKSIWLRSEIVCTAGWKKFDRLRTMVVRFGNGLAMDSNVFRPITMTPPVVIFLNHLKSSARCHGIRLPRPMTRFSDMAAMALKCLLDCTLRLVPIYTWNCSARTPILFGVRREAKRHAALDSAREDGRWKMADGR